MTLRRSKCRPITYLQAVEAFRTSDRPEDLAVPTLVGEIDSLPMLMDAVDAGFGDRYVPLLPYGYVALDHMYTHIVAGTPLPDLPTPQSRPRGAAALEAGMLGLPH